MFGFLITWIITGLILKLGSVIFSADLETSTILIISGILSFIMALFGFPGGGSGASRSSCGFFGGCGSSCGGGCGGS